MYLGDRDLFVAAAVFTVAALALAAASPDEYFRRAEDVKADPKLPPGEVVNSTVPSLTSNCVSVLQFASNVDHSEKIKFISIYIKIFNCEVF